MSNVVGVPVCMTRRVRDFTCPEFRA